MKASRLKALVWREYKDFFRARWRWLKFFYFPLTSLVIWGLFALWTGEFASLAGKIALFVNVFWTLAYLSQASINLGMNEDMWHGELAHLWVSGISKLEYFLSKFLFYSLMILPNLAFMLLLTHFLFVDLADILFQVLMLSALTIILSVGIALFIAGLIFLLGADYTWLAWSSLQFFVLLSFPLIPLELLPIQVQRVARLMPYTALFQAVKNVAAGKAWVWEANQALLMVFLYLLLGWFVYTIGFEASRRSGRFAKEF